MKYWSLFQLIYTVGFRLNTQCSDMRTNDDAINIQSVLRKIFFGEEFLQKKKASRIWVNVRRSDSRSLQVRIGLNSCYSVFVSLLTNAQKIEVSVTWLNNIYPYVSIFKVAYNLGCETRCSHICITSTIYQIWLDIYF